MARGIQICSLDPRAQAINALRAALDLGEGARSGYVQEIPFDGESFDAVVMQTQAGAEWLTGHCPGSTPCVVTNPVSHPDTRRTFVESGPCVG
jgi:hypothetical protein